MCEADWERILATGCGNGKYLNINNQAYKVGCDYCLPLVKSAKEQDYEVMVCNGLHLPYRDQCFDAILSIAVIHHFSTKERRIQAIKEMARTLRVGGKVMIYVWAMEQKRRKFEKQDVFIPWNPILPPSKSSETKTGSSVHPGDGEKHFQPFSSNNLLSLEHSNCDKHQKTNCTTSVGMADVLLVEKFLKFCLFSQSTSSVMQFGSNSNSKTPKGPWTFQDYTGLQLFDVNSGVVAFEQNKTVSVAKFPYGLFSYRQNFEDVFTFLSESRSPSQHNNTETRTRFFDFPSAGPLQIPESSTTIFQGCSTVSLPDLASQTMLQSELHRSPLENGSTASSQENKVPSTHQQLQRSSAVDSSDWSLQSKKLAKEKNEQISYDDACLRYYHVFKQGELVELIEKHIEDLHVIQTYYDHANWCVVAEKLTIWRS
uniref:Putative methyltransferase KIAA1456 n=1 Tax=Callorhinchus milii TaxID=7868 RepID=V9KXG9_CALMI|eukprot:gi/632948200/ref/XP_007889460.1/ PREDICTED: putative methyltransferase KIAA1456 homolog isoform X2 [Callorhinchus milii]